MKSLSAEIWREWCVEVDLPELIVSHGSNVIGVPGVVAFAYHSPLGLTSRDSVE